MTTTPPPPEAAMNLQTAMNLQELVSKAESRDEIESIIELINTRHRELWAEIRVLVDIRESLQNKRSNIDLNDMFPTPDNITPEKVMSLNWEKVTGELHNTVYNWFHTYKYIGNFGYIVETLQPLIQVRFNKNDPVEPQIAEVLEFVPYLKEFEEKNSGKIKYISVMEHTLSAYGSYSIHIKEDKVLLTVIRYHRFEVVKEFEDLESCLRYVHENHPLVNDPDTGS